jgi:hypothetical protein
MKWQTVTVFTFVNILTTHRSQTVKGLVWQTVFIAGSMFVSAQNYKTFEYVQFI